MPALAPAVLAAVLTIIAGGLAYAVATLRRIDTRLQAIEYGVYHLADRTDTQLPDPVDRELGD